MKNAYRVRPLFLLVAGIAMFWLLLLSISVSPALAEGGVMREMLPIDLTPVLQGLLGLLASLLTAKVIPWLKERTTQQQRQNLQAMSRMLVFAAEEIFAANQGKEKLAYVKEHMLSHGYAVDIDAIEAAVHEMRVGEAGLHQE